MQAATWKGAPTIIIGLSVTLHSPPLTIYRNCRFFIWINRCMRLLPSDTLLLTPQFWRILVPENSEVTPMFHAGMRCESTKQLFSILFFSQLNWTTNLLFQLHSFILKHCKLIYLVANIYLIVYWDIIIICEWFVSLCWIWIFANIRW